VSVATKAPVRGGKAGTYFLHGLARVRDEQGYSLRELARMSGVAHDTIWQLERLHRSAEPRTRRKLADALGTTIKELRTPDEEGDDE
jgi:transcriptional regulator with XRE-family HTH domain